MSVTGKYVSLKTIVERVYSDFGLNFQFSYDEAAEWAGSLLAQLGCTSALEDKVACAKVHEGRFELPCDLESITQIAKLDGAEIPNCSLAAFSLLGEGTAVVPISVVDTVTRTFELCKCEDNTPVNLNTLRLIPMRWSTDNFHYKYHNNMGDYNRGGDYSYKLNRGYGFPNFKEGRVAISYKGIPLDDEGYPMIPHEEFWRNAVKWEIGYKVAFKAYMSDVLTERKFNLMERDRDWYIAQAVNKSKIFTNDDEAQSFVNQMTALIPRGTGHENFFRNISREQQIYNQPVRRW